MSDIGERVIQDVEENAAAMLAPVTDELLGYFVPIDQWRALRSLLRTPTPDEGSAS